MNVQAAVSLLALRFLFVLHSSFKCVHCAIWMELDGSEMQISVGAWKRQRAEGRTRARSMNGCHCLRPLRKRLKFSWRANHFMLARNLTTASDPAVVRRAEDGDGNDQNQQHRLHVSQLRGRLCCWCRCHRSAGSFFKLLDHPRPHVQHLNFSLLTAETNRFSV